MDMRYSCPRFTGGNRLVGNLHGRNREIGRHDRCVDTSGNCGSDNGFFFHLCTPFLVLLLLCLKRKKQSLCRRANNVPHIHIFLKRKK
jgi:hypothetical protein